MGGSSMGSPTVQSTGASGSTMSGMSGGSLWWRLYGKWQLHGRNVGRIANPDGEGRTGEYASLLVIATENGRGCF